MLERELKSIDILLVEDNEGDIFLTKKAFEKERIENNIQVAMDGEKALEILRQSGDENYPDAILLDINLPGKNGREVLSEIKEDDALKSIPVIILTSSKAEQDMVKTYGLHADSYMLKPIDVVKFQEIMNSIEEEFLPMPHLNQGCGNV